MTERKSVAHIMAPYIRETETFIYDRIANNNRYEPFVLTDEAPINREQFPVKTIHTLASRPLPERKLDTLLKKTAGFSLYYFRQLKKNSPRVAHAHYGPVGAAALPTCRAAGVPLVVSFYGIDASAFLDDRSMMAQYKKMFAGADIISTLSADMSTRLVDAGCPSDKIRVHHLAVDVEAFSSIKKTATGQKDNDIFRIVSVGRMVPKKGMLHLVKSFNRLVSEHPDSELHIYGGGPMEKEVRGRIEDRKLTDKVTIFGHCSRNTVLNAIASASAFALFSITGPDGDQEGTPTVLIEAGALGIPSVSTFHAGIPEIISNNKTGLLVEEKDEEGFAAHLLKLAGNRNEAQQMGEAAREKISREFSIRSVIEEIEKTYDEIS